jgi:hypothetical protein
MLLVLTTATCCCWGQEEVGDVNALGARMAVSRTRAGEVLASRTQDKGASVLCERIRWYIQ